MGPELMAMLPALGLTAGGTLMQMAAQREQADDKRAVLNRQLQRDDEAQQKSAAMVQNEGQLFAPEQRAQAIAAQEVQAFDQSQKDLQTGAGGAAMAPVQTAGDAGNVSADFIRSKGQRAVSEGDRLTSIAREIAKTRAPGLQLSSEGQRRATLAGDLGSLAGTNRNMGRATQNDADSVQQPGYGALGAIASSIGASMAGSIAAKKFLPSGMFSGAPPSAIGFGAR